MANESAPNIIVDDAIKIAEAIASAATAGTGSASLDPVQALVGGKTLDASISLSFSKGSAPPKGNPLNDGIRLGEAFAQAFLTGSGSATLDPVGFSLAGNQIVCTVAVSVTAR